MKLKKDKIPEPPVPSDGNPGQLQYEKSPEEPDAIPQPREAGISELEMTGYGVMRLLTELQGLRAEQLKIIEVLEEIKNQ